MRYHLLLVLGCALAGCQRTTPAAPANPGRASDASSRDAEQGDTIKVHLGETRQVRGGLAVEFKSVQGDSRCPMNVVCVWQGDAAVRLGLSLGGERADTTLHSTLEPRAIVFGGYDVGFVHLEPYPIDGQKPDSSAYVVTLTARPH
jgi:hypothetical protein